MQQAPDIGAVDADPAALQFDTQLVQRQFANLGKPLPNEFGMPRQLAPARRMALTARLQRARQPPQLHQIVHKTRRHPEMSRRFPVAMAFIDIRSHTLTQRQR
jgi:hypothetical protein